jgi:NitT/TauT family transport system substrate-binding protein
MMKRLDLDISKVNIVPYDPAYTAFYSGEVQVSPAYSTGGLIKMRQKGLQLNLIWPDDYGIHFYSDTVATTDRLIATTRIWSSAPSATRMVAMSGIKAHQPNTPDSTRVTGGVIAMPPLVHTGGPTLDDPGGAQEWRARTGLLKAPIRRNRPTPCSSSVRSMG